jgi:hypothetical protein
VSHLAPGLQTHFLTGTAAPCTSIFKPVWLGAELPESGPAPTGTYDEAALFWRHEALHRAVLRNYAGNMPLYAADRDAMEGRFVTEAMAIREKSSEERAAFSARCFAEADEAEAAWRARITEAGFPDTRPFLYASAWRGFERAAAKDSRRP